MAAGDEQGRHAADLLDGDVTVVVDVGDDQADLVGVRGHDDLRAAGRADVEPDVAQRIGLDFAEGRQAPAYDFLSRRLEPRRARGEAQRPQQFDIGGHGHTSFRQWRSILLQAWA